MTLYVYLTTAPHFPYVYAGVDFYPPEDNTGAHYFGGILGES